MPHPPEPVGPAEAGPGVASPAGARWLTPLGWILLSALYLFWGASPQLGDFGGDNAAYLLIAESFSPYAEPTALARETAERSGYPVLYPLALGLLGGAGDLPRAHLITVCLLVLSFAALHGWLRASGLGPAPAAAATLLFASARGTYLLALEIQTEPLYLLASLCALAWASRAEGAGGKGWWWWATALAVGAATMTRSAGVALLAAFLLRLLVRRPAGAAWIAMAALLPQVVWTATGRNAAYVSQLLAGYSWGSPGDLLAAALGSVRILATSWIELFTPNRRILSDAALGAAGLACLAGTIERLREGRLDAVYVLAYLALVLVWPFPGEAGRLLVAVAPALLGHGAHFLCRLPGRRIGSRLVPVVPAAALALVGAVTLPQAARAAARFVAPMPEGTAPFRRTQFWQDPERARAEKLVRFVARLTSSLARAAETIPPGECVLSVKPSIVSLYTRRPSYPVPTNEDDEGFWSALEGSGCRYLFLIGADTQSAPGLYPFERMGATIETLDTTRMDESPDSRTVAILARWDGTRPQGPDGPVVPAPSP